MSISLLIISIVLLLLFGIGFVFMYSFYFNANNKLYRKLKLSYSTWGMFSLLILVFFLMAILLTTSDVYDTNSLVRKNFYLIPISWILFLLSISLLIMMIIIRNKINKTRLNMANFRDEDFKTKLNELKNFNYELVVEKKHPRYFSILKQKQEIIHSMIKNFSIDKYQNVLTELIMFNETAATKWNKKVNSVQLKMFYKMCLQLQSAINK